MRLNEKVYLGVKEKILSKEYKTNEFLSEGGIARDFGVSKAPVRTALHRLCEEGFLISYARKGYLVTNVSTDDYLKLLQVRYAIESTAIRLIIHNCSDREIEALRSISILEVPSDPAYSTVNEQFHIEMAKLTENQYLVNTLREYLKMSSQLYEYTRFAYTDIQQNSYHNELIQSMLSRDIPLALDWLKKDFEIQSNYQLL